MEPVGSKRFVVFAWAMAALSLLLGLAVLIGSRYSAQSPGFVWPGRVLTRPQPTETPGYPHGSWQRYTISADGYTLALPPDWQVLPLDREGLARFVAAHDGAGAQVADGLSAWAAQCAAAGEGLWAAVAPDGPLGDATTINILRQPLGTEMSVGAFARTNLAALAQGGIVSGSASQEWLNLSAGRALRTRELSHPAGLSTGGDELGITQVFIVQGRNGYVLTCAVRADRAAEYGPILDGIVRSLRWTS